MREAIPSLTGACQNVVNYGSTPFSVFREGALISAPSNSSTNLLKMGVPDLGDWEGQHAGTEASLKLLVGRLLPR